MKTITVKQVKSNIGIQARHKKVLQGMGLGRIGKIKVLPDNESNRGMIAKVAHLVTIVE